MAPRPVIVMLLVCAAGMAEASGLEAKVGSRANPIRKVVNMLQNMQKKITAEGAKREKMFDHYMCYCNNADGTLGKSISDAETKIPQLESAIAEGSAMKKQLEADHKSAQVSRVEAKDAIAKADAIRAKDAKVYAKLKADADANT